MSYSDQASKKTIQDQYKRRKENDRRRRPTAFISKFSFIGKRKQNRRKEDKHQDYYIDLYSHKVVGIILLIFIMCIVDSLLTLVLLGRGATEINPIMNYYLMLGENYFLIFKLIFTGIGLLVLLAHQNFKRVFKFIVSICVFYALLISYQITLIIMTM